MTSAILPLPVTFGTNAGAASDGVLTGSLAHTDPTVGLLATHALPGLCITDDGGLFVDETTPFGESTGDDVEVLPATPANGDATYFGEATKKFKEVRVNVTTDGDWTGTITYEYWNGSAYVAAAGVTDGTSGWTGGTGWKTISFTVPNDWEKNTVDGVLGYWIRGVVSGFSAVTTAPQVGQGYVVVVDEDVDYTDDLTDLTDAGAGDVALLPAFPVVRDSFIFGGPEKFTKLLVVTSQARTGTATLTPKYWNGSAWAALTVIDDSAGWSAGAGSLLLHFEPPSDWVATTAANGPDGKAGYLIKVELTAMTDVTQQPLATRAYILQVSTGAVGVELPRATYTRASLVARTASAANADTKLMLLNVTQGTWEIVTWPGATAAANVAINLPVKRLDKVAVVQIQEDGTTEYANGEIYLHS